IASSRSPVSAARRLSSPAANPHSCRIVSMSVMWKVRGYCAIPFAGLTLPAHATVCRPRCDSLADSVLPWKLRIGDTHCSRARRTIFAAARRLDEACGRAGGERGQCPRRDSRSRAGAPDHGRQRPSRRGDADRAAIVRRSCGRRRDRASEFERVARGRPDLRRRPAPARDDRSEEHTSELQSPCNLACRLLLEKKKKHTREVRDSPAVSVSLCSCFIEVAPASPSLFFSDLSARLFSCLSYGQLIVSQPYPVSSL